MGSSAHYQDIAWRRVNRLIGSDPTLISSNCDSVFEQCRSFHSLRATGVACTAAAEGQVPTKLISLAQLASHRLAGACHTPDKYPFQPVMAACCAAGQSATGHQSSRNGG